MTGMMLYVSLGLMVLTVLSSRYWRRQIAATRQSQSRIREKLEELGRDVADVESDYARLATQYAELERKTAKAEQDMEAALLELEQKKAASPARYFVFDRLEPRQGRFWEAAVRCNNAPSGALSGQERVGPRGWIGIRRFILIADNDRDVRERVAGRFPRKAGFDLLEVVPCRLDGLSVNRIAELSTFRKQAAAEEAARPARRATATARS